MSLFDGMEVFVRVVEAGSFTAAAAGLGLTKSSVSDSVRRLESGLGVRLLNRTTRRLAPTEAGQAFYARCRRAVAEAAAARTEARALQADPAGKLRVASPEGFSRVLAPVLERMMEESPGLEVELIGGAGAVDLVEARIDLAIRVTAQPAENLIVRRIGTSRVVIVASPAYLERRRAPATPSELDGHRLIGFSPLHWGHEWRFEGPAGPVAAPIRPSLATNMSDSLREAALASVGIAALPEWLAAQELASGALQRVLRDYPTPESGIYAVYPSNRLMAGKVRRFAEETALELRSITS